MDYDSNILDNVENELKEFFEKDYISLLIANSNVVFNSVHFEGKIFRCFLIHHLALTYYLDDLENQDLEKVIFMEAVSLEDTTVTL